MSQRTRIALVIAGAFVFGVLAAWLKGPDTDGISALSQVRTDVGNLSTPWLLVAFVAGSTASGLWRGAVFGLAATMAALLGFYLLTSMFINVGGLDFPRNIPRELFVNRVYLEGGLLTGSLFGALGAWWSHRRSIAASVLVGAAMMCEPLLLAVIGRFSSGVLQSGSLPLFVRIVPGFGISGDLPAIQLGVYATEFVVGLAILILGIRRARTARVTEG
jgi:Family of unknown function (DUF6518)